MATKLTSAEAFELIKAEYIKQCNEQCDENCSTNMREASSIDEGDLEKLLKVIRTDGNYDESDEDYYHLIINALIDEDWS